MKLEGIPIDVETKANNVIMNEADAQKLGVYTMDRVRLMYNGKSEVAVVDLTDDLVPEGKLGLSHRFHQFNGDDCSIDGNCLINVSIASKPKSVQYIKQKMDDKDLDTDQIQTLINDINRHALSDIEMGAYVSAIYMGGLSLRETCDLTEAMVDAGETINWDTDIRADKHSIGGVPGNRVTPVIIPIIAAAGITIPKTSSRSITSPAGTADTMEVLADVEFEIDQIKDIVNRTNGCLVWGGAVNLSPVDDKIIRAEHPMSLDPEGQVVASVLSKKKSAGSTHVVIDIPYGEGAKVTDVDEARDLGERFKHIGNSIGMDIRCTITKGDEPIGRGIGPALEARDCIKVLQGDGPADLRNKSLRLANILLDMCGHEQNAEELLDSGQAMESFREILADQNGDPDVLPDDIEVGNHTATITADGHGVIKHIDNETIDRIAFRAGAPDAKGAGIYLHRKAHETVSKGDPLMTVYAEKENKLDEARTLFTENSGFRIQDVNEMLVEEF